VITAVWTLAFLIMVIADLVMLYVPGLSPHVGIIATILAIVAAGKLRRKQVRRHPISPPLSVIMQNCVSCRICLIKQAARAE
jgi:hypothetical protein